MLKILSCALIGYLLGSLNPAALFALVKKENLRKKGTGNLGATNAMLILGKGYGTVTAIFDTLKSLAAAVISSSLFENLEMAGIIAAAFAVVGHVYPFYLNFRGGKGLASFGGLVLYFDPAAFLILFLLAIILMLITNYGVVAPLTGALLFPPFALLKSGSLAVFLLSLSAGAILVLKHIPNIKRAIKKEDTTVRDFFKNHL